MVDRTAIVILTVVVIGGLIFFVGWLGDWDKREREQLKWRGVVRHHDGGMGATKTIFEGARSRQKRRKR